VAATEKRFMLIDDRMAMSMWDPETNQRNAADIDLGDWRDETAYNWRCKACGHRFAATLEERTTFGYDSKFYCPACYPNEGEPENHEDTFEAQFPAEAALWDEYRLRYQKSALPANKIKPGNYIQKIGFPCPQPGHAIANCSSIDFILGHVQAGRPCHRCRKNARFDAVAPGVLFAVETANSSSTENKLRKELDHFFRLGWPGLNALKFASDFAGNRWGRPDILIPGLRVAVEFDGRPLGKPPQGHVTREGKELDLLKDQCIREVGWEVVRVRTARMGLLGPFDVKIGVELTDSDVVAVAWSVINASLKLDTLIGNLGVLKPPAEDLIMEDA